MATQDTVYNTKTLSKWFAIGAILLLVAVVWAVIEDYDRPWKGYARQAQRVQAAKSRFALKVQQASIDPAQLAELEKQLADIQSADTKIVDELESMIKHRIAVYFKANQEYQFVKAAYDEKLYKFEHAVHDLKSDKAKKLRPELDRDVKHVARLKLVADTAERARDEALARRTAYGEKRKKVEDEIFKLTSERNRLLKLINQNGDSLGNLVRNAPVVDFIAPTIKINQVVLAHLKDDYFFNKVPRVDRCMTCHAMANKEGFEDFPQPYKTHPKLHLMVGPASKHPVEKVGCTTCHAGVPQSVDFTLSAHTPRDAAQEAEWEEKYHYHRSHHIGTPMIPVPLVEGKCIQCHAKQSELAEAPTFNAGMRLIERFGCYGCHKFGGPLEEFSKVKKAGPGLAHVGSKLTEQWIQKWLWDPKAFRPTTLMPSFWKTHNNSDPESLARAAVEIESIAHYMVAQSQPWQPVKLASNSLKGDSARGQHLVESVGCLGCHAIQTKPRENPKDPRALGYVDPRVPNFGPELNQLGSKVSSEWLVSWLLNPQQYHPGTSMPSLKLSEQEAVDIASFLLELRNPAWEQATLPSVNDALRDSIVTGYLEKTMPPQEASAKLASMSLDAKKKFLGEKFVSHYGCYGCHALPGWENAPKIGAELTYEGSKDVSKFAFENVQLHHKSRHDWIFTKIRTPRIWDVGKKRDFEGKTRMPHFGFTDAQAQAITAIVIGHENKNVDNEATFKVDGRWEQIIAGQQLVHQKNCIGCHALDMGGEKKGGDILAHYPDDATLGPPNLNTQGAKTKTDWLYAFLLNPNVKIRPWLEVRMPQFQMSESTAMGFTRYFAAVDRAEFPYDTQMASTLSDSDRRSAAAIVEQLGCMTCHAKAKAGEDLSAKAPHFENVKGRLKPTWLAQWLKDPAAIMPGTRMPTLWPLLDDTDPKSPRAAVPGHFGDDALKQIDAVRDYLFSYPGEAEFPATRARPAPQPQATTAATR